MDQKEPKPKNERQSKAMIEVWSRPGFKEMMSQKISEAQSTPERRKRTSQNTIELWKRPEYRERMRLAKQNSQKQQDSYNKIRKLSRDDVLDIRARLEAGEPQISIAKRHGIPQSTVSFIKNGKTYKSVV